MKKPTNDLDDPCGLLAPLPERDYNNIKVRVVMERAHPMVLPDGTKIKAFFHLFPDYHRPIGGLCNFEQHRECHALFYYAVTAREMYEAHVLGRAIEYEGDASITPMFRRHFEHVGNLYEVLTDIMSHHWHCITLQSQLCKIPILPDEERYRFNRACVIN